MELQTHGNGKVKEELRTRGPKRVKLNQIKNVQCEWLCVATNVLLYGLGALFGARVVSVVSENDV